jgi:carbon-monoxide dehydrogenase medium subunit
MYPSEFAYHAPTTLADAVKLLQGSDGEVKVLAGGQSLIPLMKLRLAEPKTLIDIGRIAELKGIRQDGEFLVIGAATPYLQIMTTQLVDERAPLLTEAIRQVGDMQVRARGTIGGSLAHADPAGDVPAAVVALDGQITAVGPGGKRSIAAREFFVDLLTTALKPDEVLTEVRIPATSQARTGSAYIKHRHPASGYAVVGIAAIIHLAEDGTCQQAHMAITGAGSHAARMTATEQALTGKSLSEAVIADAATHATEGLELLSDSYATGEFRAHLATVLTRRAITAAAARARGESA